VIETIRWRQAAAFAILLLGLLGAGLLGINSLKGLTSEFDEGMAQVRRVAEIGTELQRGVLELIFAGEGYLANGSLDTKRRFAQLAGRTQEIAQRYREIEGLTAAEAQQVERLTTSLTQLEVDFARAHALYDLGRRAEARNLADAAQPLAEEVANRVAALGEGQSQALEGTTAALQAHAGARSNYLLAILIVTLLLGAGLAYATVRSIDRPLAELVAGAEELGAGHLRTRVSVTGMPREFAAVGAAFNTMAGGLSDVAAQVVTTASQLSSSAADFSAISEQVAGATHEVAEAMTEISDGADRQAVALNETAAAVVELRAGAEAIESDATQNRQLSHSIRQQAGDSQTSIREAVTLLLTLRHIVHASAEEIAGLQSVTKQISGFVRRIASIAEQTHLLSLNAAIEAAHAGHEGRGFAVVADEVGKLAADADSAAREVEEAVGQLRSWVDGAVIKMQDGEKQVVQVEGVARGAEDALQTIAAGLDTVSAATDQAMATVQRSRMLLEQVSGHVETVSTTASAHAARSQDVSAAVQQQTATTQQISASVAGLVAAAKDLRRIVGEWEV